MEFTWADLLAPLTVPAITTSLVCGLFLGVGLRRSHLRMSRVGFYWAIAGSLVFYVPVSLIRAWEGSSVWERLLVTAGLWSLFLIGVWFSSTYRRR